MDPATLIVAMGVPSAITGFCFWLLEHKMEVRESKEHEERSKRQKELDQKEEVREKNQLYIIKSVGAAIALGEATAKAVQRIPDAHCNGDMSDALAYAQKVKHQQKDFLDEQAVKRINQEDGSLKD